MRQEVRAAMAQEAAPSRLTANIYDTPGGESYVVEIPVPGLESEEITLEVDPFSLVVRTEPRSEENEAGRTYIHREHSSEAQSRVFEFPMEIDTDNVQATLSNGMLRIRLPKAAAGRRKVVRIIPETGRSPAGGQAQTGGQAKGSAQAPQSGGR
jgi:HSP20 family molecular chaperone IbpA